jgi:hypothetical protein
LGQGAAAAESLHQRPRGPVAVGLSGLAPWPEIDGYLDRALDLAPAEREHWLTELTSSQPGIANILRELLAEREADALQNLAASYHMTGRHREAFEYY